MQLELLVDGYMFLEAPRVDADNTLYFTDIFIGGIFRRTPGGKIVHILPDRKWIGGLALNADGRLVAAGRGGPILVDKKTGKFEALVEAADGQAISAVNDIQPDGDGGLYAGGSDAAAQLRMKTKPQPLIHISPNRTARRVAEDIKSSNGIGLSPDRRTVYQVETPNGVLAYDRAADNSVSNRRLLIKHPYSDGLTVDSEGYIWIAALQDSAIKRFTPNGELDRRIDIPVKEVASLTFGGSDLRDIYVATGSPVFDEDFKHTGRIYRLRTDVVGQPTPLTRF